MRKIIFIFFAIFLAACGSEDSSKSLKTGDVITLKSWDKQELKLKRLEKGFELVGSDKLLLIDIFGTFCQPCRYEAPELFEIQSKNLDSLVILGLSYAENADTEKLKDFAKNHNAYYFITNDARTEQIVEAIVNDIKYNNQVQLPFKVLLKNGEYQDLGRAKYILGIAPDGVLKNAINQAKENK